MTRVHLIGIAGTAMATLAAMLKHRGFDVRGSDEGVYPPMSDVLASEGIPVRHGFTAANITDDLDLVIVGNAVSRGNPEVEVVLDRKVRYCSLPEAIREHFLWDRRALVVTGTHGKTTTTALAGWLLAAGGLDPTIFVGGVAANLDSSYRIGAGRHFVIEGDEYDSAFFDKTAKFLKYLPDVAVIGNLEFDHADIYRDLEEIRTAFRRFVNLVPRGGLLVVGHDSAETMALREGARCEVQTFGLRDGADWRATDVRVTPDGTRFAVRRGGQTFGEFQTSMIGEHNVRNVLAALVIGHAEGLDAAALAAALSSFEGIRRRLERRGRAGGVTVYDDFAHHPTAVASTLRAIRAAHPGRRVWAVFEPRSSTACRAIFQDEFGEAFDAADLAIVAGVYRRGLPPEDRLDAGRLAERISSRGTPARAVADVDDIVRLIVRERADGDLVVAMSNGSFGGIHDKLLAALRAAEAGPGAGA